MFSSKVGLSAPAFWVLNVLKMTFAPFAKAILGEEGGILDREDPVSRDIFQGESR